MARSWGDYVGGADDGWVVYRAPWDGPVVQAWQRNLTRIDDLHAVLRLRRVRRLSGYHEPDRVRAGYREPDGRYVLVIEYANGSVWSAAEWPASLQVVSTWTEQTVLAADDPGSGAVTLLALTPTPTAAPVPIRCRCNPTATGRRSATATPAAPPSPPTGRCCGSGWATARTSAPSTNG